MSALLPETTELTLDVYGMQALKPVKRLLGDLVGLGFLPAVIFAVDWRCRTLAAVERGKSARIIYAKVGGPKSGLTQWSLDPGVISPSLKRKASLSLGKLLSGDLRAPLQLRYTVGVAEK